MTKIAVIDRHFPILQATAWREALMFFLLENYPEVEIFAIEWNSWFIDFYKNPPSKQELVQQFNLNYPQYAGRIKVCTMENLPPADGYFTIFLNDILAALDQIERFDVPFSFGLIGGGGFEPTDEELPKKLTRVFGSPNFHSILLTHRYAEDYALRNGYCTAGQMYQLEGIFLPPLVTEQPDRIYKPKEKVKVMFAAKNYGSVGQYKAPEIFIEVVRKAKAVNCNAEFSMVGGWDYDALDANDLRDYLTIVPRLKHSQYIEFCRTVDLLIAPHEYEGTAHEAAFTGVAIMIVDLWGYLHRYYKDGEEVIFIKSDADFIFHKLLPLIDNPKEIYRIGRNGQDKVRILYDQKRIYSVVKSFFDNLLLKIGSIKNVH